MDRRRRRWIAYDASFFDGSVGVMLRERFGPAGISVFTAWLCACKRNLVPGQIEYGTEPDALAQIGLPGLELVNERGDQWTLQQLWRALAAHKQCSTSTRGRLTQVRSTNWKRWQEDAVSERAAEKKRRSRPTNTKDTHGEHDDDPPGSDAGFPRETETDTETDLPPPGSVTTLNGRAEPAEEEELDFVDEALLAIATAKLTRRLAKPDLEPITDQAAWLTRTVANDRAAFETNMRTMVAGGATVELLVQTFDRQPPAPAGPTREQLPPAYDEVFQDGEWVTVRVGA